MVSFNGQYLLKCIDIYVYCSDPTSCLSQHNVPEFGTSILSLYKIGIFDFESSFYIYEERFSS